MSKLEGHHFLTVCDCYSTYSKPSFIGHGNVLWSATWRNDLCHSDQYISRIINFILYIIVTSGVSDFSTGLLCAPSVRSLVISDFLLNLFTIFHASSRRSWDISHLGDSGRNLEHTNIMTRVHILSSMTCSTVITLWEDRKETSSRELDRDKRDDALKIYHLLRRNYKSQN